MKRILFTLCIFTCLTSAQAQDKAMKRTFGLKAGLNFLSLPKLKTPAQSLDNNPGFMAGGYYSMPSKRLGYRTELVFSRQGYDYRTSTQTGSVKLDYIVLPQLMTFNITRFFQLHAGGQIAFLLNAGVDSSANPSSIPNTEKARNYFNKINYGFAGGVEVRPIAGLLVGARYNLFFNMLDNAQAYPAYVPNYSGNLKNGLIQFYAGYQF